MSFDDYVNHITQKLRVATAIGIIKTKPSGLSIEQYIDKLRKTIKPMDYDSDVTICSDDFDIDCDDVTDIEDDCDMRNSVIRNEIINDKSVVDNQVVYNEIDRYNDNIYNENDTTGVSYSVINSDVHSSKSTGNDLHNGMEYNDTIHNENTYNGTVKNSKATGNNIHNGNDNNNDTIHNENTYNGTVQNTKDTVNDLHNRNNKYDNSIHIESNAYNDLYNFGSDVFMNKTTSDSIHKRNDNPNKIYEDNNEYNEIVYKNNAIDIVYNKYDTNSEVSNNRVTYKNNTSKSQIESQKSTANPLVLEGNEDRLKKYKISNIIDDLKSCNAIAENFNIPQSQNCLEYSQEQLISNDDLDSDITFCESIFNTQNPEPKRININDLEETQIYSLSDYSQFKNHYSESQVEKIVIDPKFIRNKHKTNLDDDSNLLRSNSQREFTQYAQNNDYDISNPINTNFNSTDINQFDANLNITNTNLNAQNKDSKNSNIKIDSDTQNVANDTPISDIDKNTNFVGDFDNLSNDSDLTDSQREVVPFKVLEELNKVKNYLKKKNDRRKSYDGSDSGYRSDSQGRTSRNSLQLSGTSLNQSAHSLLTFLISCPLINATSEITKEISRALGSLIDRLHEEESYPTFLEVLLEAITELLTSIYEDDCVLQLLTKDEKVQRVLLLNKSSHVQKYTIDKITAILQTIDTTEAYEINHTARMENLCYIFHILEIILSKHKVVENSQPSQEKILNKSSIADIWRKKWNLTKEVAIDNVEKKCSLTKCSEVLNKMIVDCMDGYSLISFVALKCFNLLQPE